MIYTHIMRSARLINELQQRQGQQSQAEFAGQLGIAQGALSNIYLGTRGIGPGIAAKIARRYPELRELVIASILRLDSEMPELVKSA